MRLLKRHLSVANVLSCMALFVALGGAAYAVSPLGNKSVKTRNLANGAVTTLKLRGGAVTPLKLRNGAVTSAKIAPGAVGSTQLAEGSVRSSDLGGGVVTEGKIKNGAVTGAKLSSSLLAQLARNVSYAKATSDLNTTTPKPMTAACPSGKQAIGGGARVVLGTSTEGTITESIPTFNADGDATGWSAVGGGSPGTFAVEVVAVCAEL